MEKELLNKNIEIMVSFARGYSGSVPVLYQGKLIDIDDNYYKIEVVDQIIQTGISKTKFKQGPDLKTPEGIYYFRKKFVIYIKEA